MITIAIDGVSTAIPEWWSTDDLAAHLCAMSNWHGVSWSTDDNGVEFAITETLCLIYGVPCRTWDEVVIESYGGTADRPTYFLGSQVFPPADYLD